MHQIGFDVTTLSQQRVHMAAIKRRTEVRNMYINELKDSNWSLNFDGKVIKGVEHQVFVLKNSIREIKLKPLILPNRKSEIIF